MKTVDFCPKNVKPCHVRGWIHSDCGEDIKKKKHPAVIIIPGGGYHTVSAREAEPPAEKYFASGYNTFILYYSVGDEAKGFTPLLQLSAAISEVRRNSEEWSTIPNQIAVCGFSAGGHLACSAGTLTQTAEFKKVLGREDRVIPNAMILCYPVITADEHAHVESIERVSGACRDSAQYKWFGLDRHVTKDTPPAFIWHTANDRCVPVQNSLAFAAALSEKDVPYELHVFPDGEHGLSVCTEQVGSFNEYNGRWVDFSTRWLDTLFCHKC